MIDILLLFGIELCLYILLYDVLQVLYRYYRVMVMFELLKSLNGSFFRSGVVHITTVLVGLSNSAWSAAPAKPEIAGGTQARPLFIGLRVDSPRMLTYATTVWRSTPDSREQ